MPLVVRWTRSPWGVDQPVEVLWRGPDPETGPHGPGQRWTAARQQLGSEVGHFTVLYLE